VVVVLLCILVDDGVALVVVAGTDEPTEDARRMRRYGVGGVEDARVIVLAIERGHVVARDRTPVDLAGCTVSPPLDAREQPLDAGAVAMDNVARDGGGVLEPCAVWLENRHQVFSTREEVH